MNQVWRKGALLACILMLCSCGSNSTPTPTDVTVDPTISDFSAATQSILPIMDQAATGNVTSLESILLKSVSYAPSDWWNDSIVFKFMTDLALSTDPAAGSESVFNLVARIQEDVNELANADAFVLTSGQCQLPTISGVVGTVTSLTGADVVTLPYLSPVLGSDYDCLVSFTTSPFTGTGAYSYAFSNAMNGLGEPYLSRIAIASTQDSGSETAYTVFVANYNQFQTEVNIFFVAYVDKGDDFAMRAAYQGTTDAHSFMFKTTLRGPLTLCNPVATNIEDEAKKLAAMGVSSGAGAGFMMKLQRVCDQKAPVTSTDPQYFCIDATTKTLAADSTLCSPYEAEMENTLLGNAGDVPFAATDFANNNVITYRTRTWQTVGGGHFSTQFAPTASMAFDTENNIIYIAYVGGDNKVTVIKSVSGGAWESLGSFSEAIGSNVDITVADGIPYVAYAVVTPPPTDIKVKRYVSGSWQTVTQGITGKRNIQLKYEAPYVYLGRTDATSTGAIYISKLDTTNDTWTTLGEGSNSFMGNSTNFKYAMAVYNGTVYVASTPSALVVKKCDAGCTSWTELGTSSDLTTTVPESVSLTATGDGPRVAYTLTASPYLRVYIFWDGAWRRYAGRPETVFTNANGVFLASNYSEVYIAFEDAENEGHLTVERFRASGWATMGASTIDISNSQVTDFEVIEGTPYLLYNDPSVNQLILKKFE